jgi:hypothetical protein
MSLNCIQLTEGEYEAEVEAARSAADELEMLREDGQPVAEEVLKQLQAEAKVMEKRLEVLRMIKAINGGPILVAREIDDPHVMAFAQIRKHERTITEETLDNLDAAIHADTHELEHLTNEVDRMRLLEELGLDNMRLIAEEAGLTVFELDAHLFIEGITELKTIKEVGKYEGVAYLRKEVPAVLKLEIAAHELGVGSLISVFRMKTIADFYSRLRVLAGVLKTRENLAAIADLNDDEHTTLTEEQRIVHLLDRRGLFDQEIEDGHEETPAEAYIPDMGIPTALRAA